MYSDSNFESDLMNSYAWDTAIVFTLFLKSSISFAWGFVVLLSFNPSVK